MKKIYNDNKIFIWGLLGGFFLQMIYLSISSTNVPIMDYWKYINMFVDKMHMGGLSFTDIWQNDGIHRSPLQFLYFILNVELFHLNAQVEIYLGAILMTVIAVVFYIAIKRDLSLNNKIINGLLGLLIILIVFNLNQYEIINEQFALSFASRIGLFVISFVATNEYLKKIATAKKYTFELGMLYFFTIESVGSGFFPAYVIAVTITIIFHYIINYYSEKNTYLKQYFLLLIILVISTFVYMIGVLEETSTTIQSSISIIEFIKNLIWGVCTMIGVGVIGFEYGTGITLAIGVLLLMLYICMIVVYLRRRYYNRTYLPLLFFLYSFGAMGVIYLGRMGRFGIDYAYSSRYVGESNFAIVGLVWIVAIYIADCIEQKKNTGFVLKRTLVIGGCIIGISVGLISSAYKEFQIAPYRKIYGEQLIENMKNIDSLATEDFGVFQASEENVRAGVELMKKYDLGIFQYD